MEKNHNLGYKHTMAASCLGIITQAIINNYIPLLFLTFQRQFDISLEKIGLLISINFGAQIIIDLIGAKYVDKIGYRISIVMAHIAAAIGLIGYGIFPFIMDPYTGILLAVIINAIGGGLTEVLVTPIVESLPKNGKNSKMAFLHSCYCWGQCFVVLFSTLFFTLFGIENWMYLAFVWAILPIFNAFYYAKVPLCPIINDGEKRMSVKGLFINKSFWLFIILMVCSGAAEICMSQWSSLFAESGLGVSKTVGDLLGPCTFAILMGSARLFYGFKSSKINLRNFLIFSGFLCVISYLIAVLSPYPVLALVGCGLCGLSVGMMWPGVVTLSAEKYPLGGTAMFALLAFAGDFGAAAGPGLMGVISSFVEKYGTSPIKNIVVADNLTQLALKTSLFFAIIFPIIMLLGVFMLKRIKNNP